MNKRENILLQQKSSINTVKYVTLLVCSQQGEGYNCETLNSELCQTQSMSNNCCHSIQKHSPVLSRKPIVSQQDLRSALNWELILLQLFPVLCNLAAAATNEQLHQRG